MGVFVKIDSRCYAQLARAAGAQDEGLLDASGVAGITHEGQIVGLAHHPA